MSKKPVLPAEKKIKLVKPYLNGEIGIYETARGAGVESSIRMWVTNYKVEEFTVSLPHKKIRSIALN